MARASGKKKIWRGSVALILGALALVVGASEFVEMRYQNRVIAEAEAPEEPVALVFGAGLMTQEKPSPLLAERLDAAMSLYRAGKVHKLLVSGDNSNRSHDETHAMRHYAVEHGIPPADVVGDFAGLSTYDTCYRAREIFGVRHVLLVTQRFHLPRALFIANSLGLDALGVAADERNPRQGPFLLREFLSRPLALLMVWLRPAPKFLGAKQPIRFASPPSSSEAETRP